MAMLEHFATPSYLVEKSSSRRREQAQEREWPEVEEEPLSHVRVRDHAEKLDALTIIHKPVMLRTVRMILSETA